MEDTAVADVDGLFSRAAGKRYPVERLPYNALKGTYDAWASKYRRSADEEGYVVQWMGQWLRGQQQRELGRQSFLSKTRDRISGVGTKTNINRSLATFFSEKGYEAPRDFDPHTANRILMDFGIPIAHNGTYSGRLISYEDSAYLLSQLRKLRSRRDVEMQAVEDNARESGLSADSLADTVAKEDVRDQGNAIARDLEVALRRISELEAVIKQKDVEMYRVKRVVERHHAATKAAVRPRDNTSPIVNIPPPPPIPSTPGQSSIPPPPPGGLPTMSTLKAQRQQLDAAASRGSASFKEALQNAKLKKASTRPSSSPSSSSLSDTLSSSPAFRSLAKQRRWSDEDDEEAIWAELAIGNLVISDAGRIIEADTPTAAEVGGRCGPRPAGCTVCGNPNTVGTCVCGEGNFCCDQCMATYWKGGHGARCMGSQ